MISVSNRATVVATPAGVTRSRSLLAASAISASPLGWLASPYGFDSVGSSVALLGSGSVCW